MSIEKFNTLVEEYLNNLREKALISQELANVAIGVLVADNQHPKKLKKWVIIMKHFAIMRIGELNHLQFNNNNNIDTPYALY